jgi:SPX domain protein involved in polyphosphate accumulation
MDSLSHTIRMFNRFELKYTLSLRQAERFKAALLPFLVPDEHGQVDGRYTLASLYLDSPDFRCYREKADGLRFRRKLRIRRYETGQTLTDEAPVYVEIKQRVDRVTQKRRVTLPYREALRLCNDRQIPQGELADQPVIDEIFVFLWQYNLRPVSLVRYERQAFTGSEYDLGLRVTFDSALTFQAHQLHLHEPACGLPMLPPNQVVMEIKVNERIPTWLADLIAAHNLHMVRISKYCRSIDAACQLPGNTWRKPLAESARDVLSTSLSVYRPLGQTVAAQR